MYSIGRGLKHPAFMFWSLKPRLFYLKRAESGQTGLCLTVSSGPGQSSCFYLDIPSFKDILVLREREFWIGRSRHEKLESSSSLLLLHYFYSPSVLYLPVLGSYFV